MCKRTVIQDKINQVVKPTEIPHSRKNNVVLVVQTQGQIMDIPNIMPTGGEQARSVRCEQTN